jgi:polynucleotide 5'-kinase involved in rRNA processing
MPEDPSNLFKLMEIGDRRINGINKKVIMIVGNVRSGKSCLYNWIVGNEMIG